MKVLLWVKGRSQSLKPFVANCLGETQSLTNPKQWRFLPIWQNPDDLVARGLQVSELANSEKWWKGPDFLGNDKYLI